MHILELRPSGEKKIKTISKLKELRNEITNLLVTKLGVSNDLATLEADILLQKAINEISSRTDIYTKSDIVITDSESRFLTTLVEERLLGKPISYLINEKEFYGRKFFVDDRVLIPRPETEHLVDEALQLVKQASSFCFFDIGTGSGIIPITLFLETKILGNKPLFTIVSDISYSALEVAKINSKNLIDDSNSIEFIQGDLFDYYYFDDIISLVNEDTTVIVTANLPYIDILDPRTDHFVKVYEPSQALFSPDRGYFSINTLVASFYAESLKCIKKSIRFKLLLEIGANQADEITSNMKNLGINKIKIIKDYSGLDRIISVEF